MRRTRMSSANAASFLLRAAFLRACRLRPVGGSLAGAWLLEDRQVGDAQAGLGERLQPVRGNRGPHLRQRALHQSEMQGAHDVLAVFGDLTERAFPQPDLTFPSLRHRFRRETYLG